jgi:hypothetical protein
VGRHGQAVHHELRMERTSRTARRRRWDCCTQAQKRLQAAAVYALRAVAAAVRAPGLHADRHHLRHQAHHPMAQEARHKSRHRRQARWPHAHHAPVRQERAWRVCRSGHQEGLHRLLKAGGNQDFGASVPVGYGGAVEFEGKESARPGQ